MSGLPSLSPGMILGRFRGSGVGSQICFGKGRLLRPFGDLFVLQSHAFAYYQERPIESLLYNHLLAARLLDLVQSAIKGYGVVIPKRSFRLDAEILVEINVVGKPYVDIGFMGRTHPESFIIAGQIPLKKRISLFLCPYPS